MKIALGLGPIKVNNNRDSSASSPPFDAGLVFNNQGSLGDLIAVAIMFPLIRAFSQREKEINGFVNP